MPHKAVQAIGLCLRTHNTGKRKIEITPPRNEGDSLEACAGGTQKLRALPMTLWLTTSKQGRAEPCKPDRGSVIVTAQLGESQAGAAQLPCSVWLCSSSQGIKAGGGGAGGAENQFPVQQS